MRQAKTMDRTCRKTGRKQRVATGPATCIRHHTSPYAVSKQRVPTAPASRECLLPHRKQRVPTAPPNPHMLDM